MAMRKFYTLVTRHRKLILAVFLAAAIISFFMKSMLSVNYDMTDYLPQDKPSSAALNVMKEEFDQGIPNARVMIKDVSIPEALQYKEKIENVDGVTSVTWLDDAADLKEPLSGLDQNTLETYYKDNKALMSVAIEEDKRLDAVSEIRKIVGDDSAMTGSAVSTAYATKNTVHEISKMSGIAVAFVLLMLLITTMSWAEPFLILIGIGVAVVINAGTNLIFGEISFVSNAAGSILQLAVSLDYSVFLIHRFTECRREIADPQEAMVEALCRSTSSIASSGLTTVIGFLALVTMEFTLGVDIGLVLTKGIAISLITVFVFTPGLVLMTYKLIDKTTHRSLLPSFKGFGRFVQRITIPIVCIFVMVIGPAFYLSNQNDFYFGSSHIFGESTQYGEETQEIQGIFGQRDSYVLMVPKGDTAKETELSEKLQDIPQVDSVLSYVDNAGAEVPPEYLDKGTLEKLESDSYSRMVLTVDAAYEGTETFDLVNEIRETAQKIYPDEYLLAGEGVSTCDLRDTVTGDMKRVNFIAIGAVFLILLLMMRKAILPVILVLCIETAVWINLAVPVLENLQIFYIAYLIISSIQLGATVDYAILMTDRYRENRESFEKKDAVVQTIMQILPSILTSGSALAAVGYLMGCISTNGVLAQLGVFIGRGALISLAVVIFVLPGMLYIFDRFITKPKKEGRRFLRRKEIEA